MDIAAGCQADQDPYQSPGRGRVGLAGDGGCEVGSHGKERVELKLSEYEQRDLGILVDKLRHELEQLATDEQEGARVAIGQTEAGRYLRVIYVPDPEPGSVFVITAYELRRKALTAYRRRRRRRQK
ncbi:MAG: DUF4258 domain-containing protein [Anaerolineales bacterium]|nr:MAG: DUF4258 domain-containing protein [Anaerolineales bacterium]